MINRRLIPSRQRARSLIAPIIAEDSLYATLSATAAAPTVCLAGGARLTLHAAAANDDAQSTAPAKFTSQVVYTGGVMYPQLRMASGYQGAVVVDVTGIEAAPDTPINRDHDPSRPVGHCFSVGHNNTQFLASGLFSLDNDDAREIVSSLSAEEGQTFPWKTSIGLILIEHRMIREGEELQANGQTFVGPLLYVSRSRLKHIAILTEPGDMDVPKLTLSAQLSTGTFAMDFDSWVSSLGLDIATLSDAAKAALKAQYDAQMAASSGDSSDAGDGSQTTEPAPTAAASRADGDSLHAQNTNTRSNTGATSRSQSTRATVLEDLRATFAEETARTNQINQLCARFGNPEVNIGGRNVLLAAYAIQHGWDTDRCELEARRHQELEAARNNRPHGPAIHSTSRAQRGTMESLQAGLLLRCGVALDSPSLNAPTVRHRMPQWLQAGINDTNRQRIMDHAHEFRDLSMLEAARCALASTGAMVPSNRIDMLHAAFGSGAVSQLFGATIGARLLASYAEISDFSLGWTQEAENPDLEEHDRTRMEAAGDLSLHPPGGEADYARRSAVSEKVKVDRFSRQYPIDEADLMSDNFGRLAQTPRDFGLAAGRMRPNVVAAVLLANANLAVTGRALFNTTDVSDLGTGKALARATLSEAIATLGLRRDGEASLNLQATHLLVPPALQDLAVQLLESNMVMVDGGAGSANVFSRYRIKPVSEARLQNGMLDPVTRTALSGSPTNWILVSSEAHTIEVTFLEGAGRVPIVTTEQLTGGRFGLNVTVRHYVGAKALDFRGFVRGRA